MTDEIPDDVVERAVAEFLAGRGTVVAVWMRAALRVAVEWEREQCALAVEAMPPFAGSRKD